MSTLKTKNVQIGTSADSSDNYTLYQSYVPDGSLRIGRGNFDASSDVAILSGNTLSVLGSIVATDVAASTFTGNLTGNASTVTNGVYTSRTVSAGSGLTGGGSLSSNVTISHADTSTQASVNNSGNTFIQDVTLDDYGHVTGLNSLTVLDPNNSTITLSAGSGISGGGSFSLNQSNSETITFSHADTSSQVDVDNTGSYAVIASLGFDDYGHVNQVISQGLTSWFYTKSDVDSRYYQIDRNTSQYVNTSSSSLNVTLPSMGVGQLQLYAGAWTSSNGGGTVFTVKAPSGGSYQWVIGSGAGYIISPVSGGVFSGGSSMATLTYPSSISGRVTIIIYRIS